MLICLPRIRAAIGKANLLVTKKMKQFRGLCEDCMSPPDGLPPTKPDDLLGFWEMVSIHMFIGMRLFELRLHVKVSKKAINPGI